MVFSFLRRGSTSTQSLTQRPPADYGEGISPAEFRKGQILAAFYGIIDCVLNLPSAVGYASVIFAHPLLIPYLPVLVKMMFLSAVLHQSMHSLFDPLKFAISGVQDSAIVFMAAMVAGVAEKYGSPAALDANIATVFLCLVVGTLSIAATLFFLSFFPRLVGLVSYVPLPVIGGFLSGIGYFIMRGGLGLSAGISITLFDDYQKLFTAHAVALWMPALLYGILVFVLKRKVKHFLVTPVCMILCISGFYIFKAAAGYSMDDCRSIGWMYPELPPLSPFYKVWSYYDLGKVDWDIVQAQSDSYVKMAIIFLIAVLLQYSAVEAAVGVELQSSKELRLEGIANILVGCLGGLCGSRFVVISVLNSREIKKYSTKLAGYVYALCMLLLFTCDIPIVSFVPKFFFGGVLISIGIELMVEWMFDARSKMSKWDLLTVWISFGAIVYSGVNLGLLIGFAVACFFFDLQYSRVPVIRESHLIRPSSVVRLKDERTQLQHLRQQVRLFVFEGYMFFGSARQVQKTLQGVIHPVPAHSPSGNGSESKRSSIFKSLSTFAESRSVSPAHSATGSAVGETPSAPVPIKYVVMDCTHLRGIDSSAAATMVKVKRFYKQHDITMVLAGMSPPVENVLREGGVIGKDTQEHTLDDIEATPLRMDWNDGKESHTGSALNNEEDVQVFSDLDLALAWMEDQLLLTAKSNSGRSTPTPLAHSGSVAAPWSSDTAHNTPSASPHEGNLSCLQTLLRDSLSDTDIRVLESACQKVDMEPHSFLFRRNDPSDALWFINTGAVQMLYASGSSDAVAPPPEGHADAEGSGIGFHSAGSAGVGDGEHDEPPPSVEHRLFTLHHGGVVGDTDLFTSGTHLLAAKTIVKSTFHKLSVESMRKVERSHPHITIALYQVILSELAQAVRDSLVQRLAVQDELEAREQAKHKHRSQRRRHKLALLFGRKSNEPKDPHYHGLQHSQSTMPVGGLGLMHSQSTTQRSPAGVSATHHTVGHSQSVAAPHIAHLTHSLSVAAPHVSHSNVTPVSRATHSAHSPASPSIELGQTSVGTNSLPVTPAGPSRSSSPSPHNFPGVDLT
eukprot:GILI01006995.1.p1 GENE.GILI01006995.1~~GILI01006995.1.p1  ORF type:complete len:1072 (-),score=252.62 GILI01006995.1:251-3466(-)